MCSHCEFFFKSIYCISVWRFPESVAKMQRLVLRKRLYGSKLGLCDPLKINLGPQGVVTSRLGTTDLAESTSLVSISVPLLILTRRHSNLQSITGKN